MQVGVAGSCPARARRTMMRCTDPAIAWAGGARQQVVPASAASAAGGDGLRAAAMRAGAPQDVLQFRPEPGMQHHVGGAGHAFHAL